MKKKESCFVYYIFCEVGMSIDINIEDSCGGFTKSQMDRYFLLDVDSGVLFYKERYAQDFIKNNDPDFCAKAWNGKWKGKPAGNINKKSGYLKIKLNGKTLSAHRIIYLMFNNCLPKDCLIDHIDGDKINNRPQNLRIVDQAGNSQNQRKAQSTSVTGVLGVSFTSSGKYQARIGLNKKDIYLGSFSDIDDAKKAYIEAKKKLHISQIV